MTLPKFTAVSDAVFIILLMWILTLTMRKHGQWKKLSGFGDFVTWLMISWFIFGITKYLFISLWLGFKIPLEATDEEHTFAAIITICFWFILMYWRIPQRLLNIVRKSKVKENSSPKIPRIDPPPS